MNTKLTKEEKELLVDTIQYIADIGYIPYSSENDNEEELEETTKKELLLIASKIESNETITSDNTNLTLDVLDYAKALGYTNFNITSTDNLDELEEMTTQQLDTIISKLQS